MESVSVHLPILRPLPWNGIGSRRGRQRGVKSRVECRYLRDQGQDLLDSLNAFQARRVMEGREFAQFMYCSFDLGRYPHRSSVTAAAVNNAMPHNVNIVNSRQGRRRPVLQVA